MWAGKALFGDGKRQVRRPIARAGNAVLAASVNVNAAAISQPRPGRGERQSGSGPLPHSCRPPCGARAVNFRRSGRRWPGAVFGGLKNGRLGKARGCPGRCQPRRAGGAADRRGLCLGNVHFGPFRLVSRPASGLLAGMCARAAARVCRGFRSRGGKCAFAASFCGLLPVRAALAGWDAGRLDRKSTRLNSSHQTISYAVFCLKKKKMKK